MTEGEKNSKYFLHPKFFPQLAAESFVIWHGASDERPEFFAVVHFGETAKFVDDQIILKRFG